ncbi:MAG: hypothetical protein HPY50_09500 [Firmicutes bacterium]|nr:hypothetical protein [Bacillota bacterium]
MWTSEWKDEYRRKLCSAAEAAKAVRSGDLIVLPICLGQPSNLIMDAIADRKDEVSDVEFLANLIVRPYKIFKPEYSGSFNVTTAFVSTRPLRARFPAENGYGPYAPISVFSSSKMFSVYRRPTVTSLMVTPPDDDGFVNLGPDLMFTRTLVEGRMTSQGPMGGARTVIAEVNDQYVPVRGNTRVHISKFTHIVENSTPLPAAPPPPVSDSHRRIAQNVVSLLRDRDSIQIGIGAIPMIISDLIVDADLKDIGIFTEMLPTGAPKWVEKGICTNRFKSFRPGEITCNFMGPVGELYDFVRDNPLVGFQTNEITNNPAVIGSEERMVGINGGIEVDLTSQVASMSIGNHMLSGFGGQSDFAMGCKISKLGRFIIAMQATARDSQGELTSRIVPYLTPGSLVGTLACHVDYVATEFGIAGPLDGMPFEKRAEALIEIAHPRFQDELVRAAKERKLFR